MGIGIEINCFEDTGLKRLDSILKEEKLTDKQLEKVLVPFNVSFVLEGIDRVQSTLLCELKYSYVQQSQRYVTAKADCSLPEVFSEEDRKNVSELIERIYSLYAAMSEKKPDAPKGRPRPEDYVYNIPIEDARYILPMFAKTNLSVSMNASGLVKLFARFNREDYREIFADIKTALLKYLPCNLADRLESVSPETDDSFAVKLYKDDFAKLNEENEVVLLNAYKNAVIKTGLGALTSTQQNPPSKVLSNWGENAAEKALGVTERVMGYGHTSIAEQARTTFAMMCSMVTYHQQIRHRLPEMLAQPLAEVLENPVKPVIPQSIVNSKFYGEFVKLYNEAVEMRKKLYEKYGAHAFGLILNCDRIKFIISTNARMDCQMLAERICLTAQWEIRELSSKKLDILRGISPILYKSALPSCVYGKCKEGAMTCGKADYMRKKYAL